MGDGNYLGPIGDAAIAKNQGRDKHCYRERVSLDGEDVEVFLCGALGPPCVQCGAVSEVLCDFPLIGDEERTCDRPLCLRCAPEVGTDKNYCAEHQDLGPGLLLFRRPKRWEDLVAEAELGKKLVLRKPRLPKAPAPDRRWCVMSADGVRLTRWMNEIGAHQFAQRRSGRWVDTWDGFVAWHRKTYPLAPKKR